MYAGVDHIVVGHEQLGASGQYVLAQQRSVPDFQIVLEVHQIGLFLMEQVLLSEPMAKQEADRYSFLSPGQATSYFYGYERQLAIRAKALLDGRLAPSVDDVIALANPVLKHRMALTFAARADGETIGGVIQRLTKGL